MKLIAILTLLPTLTSPFCIPHGNSYSFNVKKGFFRNEVANSPHKYPQKYQSTTTLCALDEGMMTRLTGIQRSFNEMTERLADPDVINDPKLLMKVMSERSKSEEIVEAFESYRGAEGDYDAAVEMMRESGDDPEMKEMAREGEIGQQQSQVSSEQGYLFR